MQILNLNLIDGRGLPEGAVYVGRPHAGRGLPGSVFANPFPVGRVADDAVRAGSLERYRHHLWAQIQGGHITLAQLRELDGHDLACFCAPKACHAMIVAQAVEWARTVPDGTDLSRVDNPLTVPRVRGLSDWLRVKSGP